MAMKMKMGIYNDNEHDVSSYCQSNARSDALPNVDHAGAVVGAVVSAIASPIVGPVIRPFILGDPHCSTVRLS